MNIINLIKIIMDRIQFTKKNVKKKTRKKKKKGLK